MLEISRLTNYEVIARQIGENTLEDHEIISSGHG